MHACLLGFALWTLAVVMFVVGVYRWTQILTGRVAIHRLGPDGAGGAAWYRRGLRAHANCIENLPVFGAIVAVATWTGARGLGLDVLAMTVLGARVGQSVTHVAFEETPRSVSVRFAFYFVQLIAMIAMIAVTVTLRRRA